MKEKVPAVESLDDILANIDYLEKIRQDPYSRHYANYILVIKKGKILFSFRTPSGDIAFAPAKFLGYLNNNFDSYHENNKKDIIDGGEGHRFINRVLKKIYYDKSVAIENEVMDNEYKSFCNSLEIEPENWNRKYWDIYGLTEELKGGQKSVKNNSDRRDSVSNAIESTKTENTMKNLNLILYGPPGTGKTYETAFEAVKICLGKNAEKEIQEKVVKAKRDKRDVIMEKYQELSLQGRLEFLTFHQSFSYQEFVEGLRPVTNNKQGQDKDSSGGFSLQPREGIFKKICNRALRSMQDEGLDRSKPLFQVTVDHFTKNKKLTEICLEKSLILLDWATNVNWSNPIYEEKEQFDMKWKEVDKQENVERKGGNKQTFAFRTNAKIGDYVILTHGKENFVAFGEIIGEYNFTNEIPEAPHFRKVKWLWVDKLGRHHSEFYANEFINHSFYKFKSHLIDWDGLEQLITDYQFSEKVSDSTQIKSSVTERGRFSGKLLRPLCVENPRRLDTHGWRSFNILLEYPNGIVYEEYIKLGGRWNDLNWDFQRGWVSVEKVEQKGNSKKAGQNYVLIIDEINRANISKVFGELITLLEVDKRIGAKNELQVRLPYSGELFGVPENLHIIGTMNTADRSIALLDTALRRRFSFREMMPDYLEEFSNIKIGGGDLNLLLRKINKRIEFLYDREHQIGHAYFIKCLSAKDQVEEVKNVFRQDIIPLLAEYFFEDRAKIAKVLEDKMETEGQKRIGCFFEAEKFAPTLISVEEQESKSEPKWFWTVKKNFEFDRLEFK